VDIIIRPFEPGDEVMISKLYNIDMGSFENFIVDEKFIFDSSQRPGFAYTVACLDGRVVGFAGLLINDLVGRAEYGPTVVEKSRRNNGIGTRLMQYILEDASSGGVLQMKALVKSHNKAGIGFFLKNGFRHQSFKRQYTNDGCNAVELVRYLGDRV
jgi:L-amino acid N-acyltransferase YncA